MRRSATTRNMPTPTATARIKAMFGTPGTCSASTCRSGSEMVIMIPITRPMAMIIHSLRVRVMALPAYSPMGVMAMSVPSVKSPMPKISMSAPKMNASSALLDTGIMKKQIRNTIIVIGSTDASDSLHFSFKRFRLSSISSFLSHLIGRFLPQWFHYTGGL